MYRLSAILLFLLIATTAMAQRYNMFGLSTTYGYTTETVGIAARAPYVLNDRLTLTPEITYFLPDVQNINGATVSEGSTEYNLNIQYSLLFGTTFTPYFIAGGNYTREILLIDDPTSTFLLLKLHTGYGANFGVGLTYNYRSSLHLFAEHKHITGSLGQQVSTIGLLYIPNRKNKKEGPIY